MKLIIFINISQVNSSENNDYIKRKFINYPPQYEER